MRMNPKLVFDANHGYTNWWFPALGIGIMVINILLVEDFVRFSSTTREGPMSLMSQVSKSRQHRRSDSALFALSNKWTRTWELVTVFARKKWSRAERPESVT